MSRKWYLALAGITLLSSIACVYFSFPRPLKALVTVESVKRLGKLAQGVEVPVQFELLNNCSSAVEIIEVSESCHCTTTKLAKRNLAPGERTTLNAQWNTGSVRGLFGSDIVVVYKQTGEQIPRFTKMRIEATVLPDIEYYPSQLTFSSKEKSKQVIQFLPGQDEKATVVGAYTSHRAFAVKLLENNSQVEVAFDPSSMSERAFATQLTVKTNCAHEPLIHMNLRVDRLEELQQ